MNALWGAGIKYGPMDEATRVRAGRVLWICSLIMAFGVGAAIGLIDSVAWGAAAAATTASVVGLAARWILTSYQ